MDDGHCGLPTEELAPLAVGLLAVPKELVQAALELELAEGAVIADTVGDIPCVFLVGLRHAEKVIAERIQRLANGTLPWPHIDPEKALPWIEQKTSLSLAQSQVAATRLALLSKVLVITGGPGVGAPARRPTANRSAPNCAGWCDASGCTGQIPSSLPASLHIPARDGGTSSPHGGRLHKRRRRENPVFHALDQRSDLGHDSQPFGIGV
jgi:hypothetical protein